jgi:hypothetical protein
MVRAALVLAVLLLAGCGGTPGGGSPADDGIGEWKIVSGRASGTALPRPSGARATLVLDGARHAEAGKTHWRYP